LQEKHMSWIAVDPERYEGQSVGSGQCVAFVQAAALAPRTAGWTRGVLVRGGNVPAGTAIATFDPDGSYGNHTDKRSHAAILVAEQAGGLLVWDQWRNHPVSQRVIRFKGGAGDPVNDGDYFHVIEQA
jgi:hypothetical protein